MGVPVELSTRDMEVSTEEIVQVDKEVQYVYGDDTSLINAMKRVTMRRSGQVVKDVEEEVGGSGSVSAASGPSGASAVKEDDEKGNEVGGAEEAVNENRLNSFLQAAAQLCEDILNEEQAVSKHSDRGRSRRGEG
jgi:hypothetical protein